MPFRDQDKRRQASRESKRRARARASEGDTMGRNGNGKGVLHANLAEGGHWLEYGGLEVDLDDDTGGLSDLSDVADKAAREQAKLMQRMMQRTYVSRRDLQQFLGESAEMGTLAQAINAEVRKDAPSILRAHEAAGRVYMRGLPTPCRAWATLSGPKKTASEFAASTCRKYPAATLGALRARASRTVIRSTRWSPGLNCAKETRSWNSRWCATS